MPDLWMDVDTALSEVPVNIMPLLDDTDFKSREVAITYDQAGMDLVWNFVTTAGAYTQTAVTPTTGGNYDWAHQGDGMYSLEIPASGGASINNDTEGFGWFTGYCTGVLPWRGPTIGFRAAALNNALIDGGDLLDVSVTQISGDTQSATDLKDFADAGYDPATNKVQGVVLVDTTTTNTDMLTAAAVNAEVDTALADYDGPTNAEMEARTLPTADYFDPAADTVANVTEVAQMAGVIGTLDGLDTAQDVKHDATQADIAALNDVSSGDVQTAAAAALTAYDPPTNAEMNARTLPTADYFDPAADTVASVTEVTQIAGTIQTLDALDTAQDVEHDATQADIAALNDLSAAQVNTEMVDVLTVDTYAESAGVPAATASLKDKIVWLATLARNKILQTSAAQTLRDDADGADIATAAVSDDGTTATRDEWT